MPENDGRGRPPTQADVGELLEMRDAGGVTHQGVLKGFTDGGAAIIAYLNTHFRGDGKAWAGRKPKYITVTGAEVMDDG